MDTKPIESIKLSPVKRLGNQAFKLCLVVGLQYASMIFVEFIINTIISIKTNKPMVINSQAMGALTLFAGSVLGIVWGSKASSSFSKKIDQVGKKSSGMIK